MSDLIEMHVLGVVPEATLEKFKALVNAEIAIERVDAHALRKEWFLGDDNAFRVIVVCESSEAMLHYFDGLLARSYGERFDEVCEWTQVELFGNPSKGVLELFEAMGAGKKIEIFRPLAGFAS